MNHRFLFLLVVLIISALVFTWGTTNYLRCYTDTPGDNYYKLCPTNIEAYAMPALIATFVMIGVVPVLTWMKAKNHRFRIAFTVLSGIGMPTKVKNILFLILRARS